MSDHIVLEQDGPVATIVINRPDKLNAFTNEMLVDARQRLLECEANPAIRVVVFRGAGDRAFCTGADLAELAQSGPFEVRESNRAWIDLFHTIETVRMPVVASVHGHCIAGGTELTLCCDLVVASEDATFGLAEARVGVIPGAGASIRITRWVGRAIAKEILMLGDPWPAAEAHRVGLVNRLVPRADLATATADLTRTLAQRSPLALAAAKRAVNIGSEMDQDRGIEYVLQEFALLFAAGDQKEGMSAFLEKRPPNFQGR
jgi:enoyl-CoA hydratase/carnithine racemase